MRRSDNYEVAEFNIRVLNAEKVWDTEEPTFWGEFSKAIVRLLVQS